MAVDIRLKRSAVAGRIPTTSSLELGEIALNTRDGRAFMKRQVGTTETIVEFATTAGSGSTVTSASYADYAANAGYAAQAGNASTATSASYAANATSASYAGTASFVNNAISSSYALSASYAQTSSYATSFNVSGNLVVGGDITANSLHVQTVTSSVIYSSGSNILGDATSDTQTLIGTVNVSGSLNVTGSVTLNNLTGSLYGTASWATSASYALVANSQIANSQNQGATSFIGGGTGDIATFAAPSTFMTSQALESTSFIGDGINVTNEYQSYSGLTPEDLAYISVNITRMADTVTTTTATFNNSSFLQPSSGSQLPPTSADNFTFFANGVNIPSGSITGFGSDGMGNLMLIVNTTALGYTLVSTDEITATGKFA